MGGCRRVARLAGVVVQETTWPPVDTPRSGPEDHHRTHCMWRASSTRAAVQAQHGQHGMPRTAGGRPRQRQRPAVAPTPNTKPARQPGSTGRLTAGSRPRRRRPRSAPPPCARARCQSLRAARWGEAGCGAMRRRAVHAGSQGDPDPDPDPRRCEAPPTAGRLAAAGPAPSLHPACDGARQAPGHAGAPEMTWPRICHCGLTTSVSRLPLRSASRAGAGGESQGNTCWGPARCCR